MPPYPLLLAAPKQAGPELFTVEDSGMSVLKAKSVWSPAQGDTSRSGHYTDAKAVTNKKWGKVVVAARTTIKPHVVVIDHATRKTLWHEKDKALQDLSGGVHSATALPDGNVVVHAPCSQAPTKDNLALVRAADPGKVIPYDFKDSHASVWIDAGDGHGGGHLWAVGRTGHAKDKTGKCVLREYSYQSGDHPSLTQVAQYDLVAKPLELTYLKKTGWWESPHDIARHDRDTLWISTESRVVALTSPPAPSVPPRWPARFSNPRTSRATR
ncbi:hypothetical protein [Embleya sp. NPDC059237]|uniref:hypothetical protein n=1 Tax=Embleya sp. NPDC059237 TaxID=3346784 RepID=UPI0036C235F3